MQWHQAQYQIQEWTAIFLSWGASFRALMHITLQ
jgi:hypothetical protein